MRLLGPPWLSRAAIAVGYKVPERCTNPPSKPFTQATPTNPTKKNRQKGKARKLTREAAKNQQEIETPPTIRYTITSRNLLEQAQAVAGRVEVPDGLRKVLKRAIEARQRCAQWFQTSKVENQYSNEGHQHFISVLEQTLEILGPGKETPSAADVKEKTKGKKRQVDEASDALWEELRNRFQSLAVQETPDADENEEVLDESADYSYELEEESEETKMSLMIFCFFEDMHRVQDFLHSIWRGFKAGDVNLMTASLITNAAVDVVRQNEEEILAAAPNLFSKKRSYDTIAIVIFYADAFSQGQDPEAKMKSNEFLRPTPFDDFIYLSTAKILMKFDYLSAMQPKSPDYPLPSFPLRAGFVSRPDLLGTPYMDKKEEEDTLLSQLLIDLDLYDTFGKETREHGLIENFAPAEDELSFGLRKLRKEGVISVWLVFAARIFLDLQDILGKDIIQGRQELRAIAGNIDTVVKSTGVFSPTGDAICWLQKEDRYVKKLSEINHFWVINFDFKTLRHMMWDNANISKPDWGKMGSDAPSPNTSTSNTTMKPDNKPTAYTEDDQRRAKQADLRGVKLPFDPAFANMKTTMYKFPPGYDGPVGKDTIGNMLRKDFGIGDELVLPEHEENARNLNLRMIKPNKNPEYIVTNNPTYCGLLALNLVIVNEHAGLLLTNYHTVTTLVAHLYCEARRSELLADKWPEMDQMIEMHMDIMFAGKLPRSANEAYIRFQKLMGLSTTRRPNFHQRGLPYKEPQYKALPFSDAMRPFFDLEAPFHASLGHLEALVQSEREKIHHESKHKRRNARRKLTPLQFLMQLIDFVPSQIPKIQFDYITLTKTSYMFIRRFRSEIRRNLDIDYPIISHDDSIQPLYPDMVLKILQEGKEFQNTTRQRDQPEPQSPQMEVVARVFKAYFDIKARVAAATAITAA
ncbi:hypothetical protein G7Y89_g8792 [Cudoniella acicularis]|uniref:DUF6604 domain-containing protein n=1 Tax=Cudoniella acicularis TaxID=354080 RepID=A0A8H4W384_9HELO|nr:hypothetical protein G7Y89_g8792 [Cudoniella acicularis]